MWEVVIAEDDPDVRDLIALTLQDAGFGVTATSNGREALDALTEMKAPPDAAVIDWCMPVMDGRTLLGEMQASTRWQRVPVIVLSGAAEPLIDCPDGACCVVNKGVGLGELVARLQSLSQRAGREP